MFWWHRVGWKNCCLWLFGSQDVMDNKPKHKLQLRSKVRPKSFYFILFLQSKLLRYRQRHNPDQKELYTEQVGANVLAHWHTFHKKWYTKSTKHLNHQHLHALHNGIPRHHEVSLPDILLRGHGRIPSPPHARPPSPRGAVGPPNRGLLGLPSAAAFCLGSRSPRPSHRQNPRNEGEKNSEKILGTSKVEVLEIVATQKYEQCAFEEVLMTSSWLKKAIWTRLAVKMLWGNFKHVPSLRKQICVRLGHNRIWNQSRAVDISCNRVRRLARILTKLLYFEWSPLWHFKTARLDFVSAWWGQVRVDIQLISWNAFCYSQLRRLTGSNLLTFFLTYLLTFFLRCLLTFFLTYLLTFFLTYLLKFFLTYVSTFFLTYLLTFFLTYLLTCFLTYLLTFFLTYQRQNIASTASHKSHSTNSIFTSHHAAKAISMTTLCLSNGNSTVAFDCIGQPR